MKRIVGSGRMRKLKGRWQLIVTVEDTATGKRYEKTRLTDIRCSETTNKGRARAEAALDKFTAEVCDEIGAVPASACDPAADGPGACGKPIVRGLEEYIAYRRASGGISHTTADGYGYSLLHIKRGFPTQRPGEVTSEDVRDWISQSLMEGHSKKVMKKAYTLLKQYYNYLLTLQDPRVRRNPLDGVPRPRPEEPEPNALARECIPRLNAHLRDMDDCPLKRCCMLSLHTGMRIGECVAVTWGDIDWGESVVHIRRSAVRVRGEGMVLKETKGREKRVAPLDPIVQAYLADIHARDEKRYLAVGAGLAEELDKKPIAGAALMRPVGVFEDSGRISRVFTTLSDALGLTGVCGENITFHGLRHTFASQWIAAGGDVAALSAILGHKDVGFTLNVYVSPDPVAQRSGSLGMLETISAGYAAPDEVAAAVEDAGRDAFVKLSVPISIWSRAQRAARAEAGMDASRLLVSILEAADIEGALGLAPGAAQSLDGFREANESRADALAAALQGLLDAAGMARGAGPASAAPTVSPSASVANPFERTQAASAFFAARNR